ncbi:MAG: putative glycoside hydrolase, partial [Candidatus Paceibacterota bacterium]
MKKTIRKYTHSTQVYSVGFLVVALFAGAYFFIPQVAPLSYSSENVLATPQDIEVVEHEARYTSAHLETPSAVKAIYMTQCVVGTPSFRDSLVELVEETEVNSIIIDIKDFTGSLVFRSEHPLLKDNGGKGCRARDIREFIETLHNK